MPSSRHLAALFALLASSAVLPAAANADQADFDVNRWDITIGGLIGGYSVGPIGGIAGGMHIDAGRTMKNVFLYGEYDFVSVGDSPDYYDTEKVTIRGQMHRLSVNARYRGARFGGQYSPVQGAVWFEGGLGNETILWNEGGRLSRRDISFGLGLEATFKVGEEKKKYIGVYYAFKGLVADSPDTSDSETCAGPCDEATGPIPYDFGAFFSLGVTFGW
jgi:hypothetical protein